METRETLKSASELFSFNRQPNELSQYFPIYLSNMCYSLPDRAHDYVFILT